MCNHSGYIEFMEKELALLKAENHQFLSNLENEKLVKSHQDKNHHSERDGTAHEIATLEAKLLEYTHTISKLLWYSFELSCQQHHEVLENILTTAAADNLLSSEDNHASSNKNGSQGEETRTSTC